MTKKKTLQFAEWFEEQHGKRPSEKPMDELMAERNRKNAEAEHASNLVDRCEMWDEKRTSALYAWQVAYLMDKLC